MLPLSTIIETPTPTWYTLSITAEMRASDIMPVCLNHDDEAELTGRWVDVEIDEAATLSLPFPFAVAEIDDNDQVVRIYRAVRQ